jgi:putative DNA primase/helicase
VDSSLRQRGINPRRSGNGFVSRYPNHEDRAPSLSIGEGDPTENPRPSTPTGVKAKKHYRTAEEAIVAAVQSVPTGVEGGRWAYRDAGGERVVQWVVRINKDDGEKAVLPVTPHKGGWRVKGAEGPLPLYRLPDLTGEPEAWVTEGEKCADVLVGLGLVGTTSAGGADRAAGTDWRPLAGKLVVIVPDHDGPGAKYAREVAALCLKLDPPAKVRVLELPGLEGGEDIADWREERHDRLAEELRAELETMAQGVPLTRPEQVMDALEVVDMSTLTPKPIEWFWPGRVARGCLTVIGGVPGCGKSFVVAYMAAVGTTDGRWCDGQEGPTGSVILVDGESDPERVLLPRLLAHGANTSRVGLVKMKHTVGNDGKKRQVMFSLRDLPELEQVLRDRPDCKLIVVDPVGSFLGQKVDAHRDNEIREVLAPLAVLAEKYGVAVVLVMHHRKGASDRADEKVMGSVGFVGIARQVWHVSKDAEDAKKRYFLAGKNNLSEDQKGLSFTIQGNPARVVWGGEVDESADDAMRRDRTGEGEGGERVERAERLAEGKRFLETMLAEGPVEMKVLKRDAEEAGLAWSTVRRAKAALGVKVEKTGESRTGPWVWMLRRDGGVDVIEEGEGEGAQVSVDDPNARRVEHLEHLERLPDF